MVCTGIAVKEHRDANGHECRRSERHLALFESHLSKENDLLIPVLVADPNVALGALLGAR